MMNSCTRQIELIWKRPKPVRCIFGVKKVRFMVKKGDHKGRTLRKPVGAGLVPALVRDGSTKIPREDYFLDF